MQDPLARRRCFRVDSKRGRMLFVVAAALLACNNQGGGERKGRKGIMIPYAVSFFTFIVFLVSRHS